MITKKKPTTEKGTINRQDQNICGDTKSYHTILVQSTANICRNVGVCKRKCGTTLKFNEKDTLCHDLGPGSETSS